MGKATDAVAERNEELKEAANYARGGVHAGGGRQHGTSDSVPVVVAGRMCACRDGEGGHSSGRDDEE